MAYLEQSAVTLLASTAGVDLNTGTKQNLYTVPVGKSCIVTHIVVRLASISLTTASFANGWNANADDVVATATQTELTGNTLYTVRAAMVGAKVGVAGDVFGSKCTINQGAAATATMDVYGYLF